MKILVTGAAGFVGSRFVERMNRTIKDATVRRFHYESHNQLRQHLADSQPWEG